MHLRRFQYFIALAEHLHFGRAAERLNLAQPALSRQIVALEEALGVALFRRTNQKVALTEAGRLFLPQAQIAIARFEQAVAIAKRAGRGEVGQLTIGYASSIPFASLFADIIYQFRKTNPDVKLNLREMPSIRQIEALQAGVIDVGFIRQPVGSPPDAIVTEVILREPLYLVHHIESELSKIDRLEPRDIANMPFIFYPPRFGSGLYEQTLSICRSLGFSPNVAQEAEQIVAIIAFVAARLGVAIVPASVRAITMSQVKFRSLDAVSDLSEVALAFNSKDGGSLCVEAFWKLATQIARESLVAPSSEASSCGSANYAAS